MKAFYKNLKFPDGSVTFSSQFRTVLAPFVEQDYMIEPVSIPLRSFIAMWQFFVMVITCLYRSKLTSLLAFPVFTTLPETFEDLAKSDLEIGFMKHGDSAYNTLKVILR